MKEPKKEPMYKRGTYNKPQRVGKKISFNLSPEQLNKIIILSVKQEMTYAEIIRSSFELYWKVQTKLNTNVKE